MPGGYWWQCERCGVQRTFKETTGSNSAAAFIWDHLAPSDWDQSLLVKLCPECGAEAFRITYDFPRRDHVVVQAHHIVGHLSEGGSYVPMMWETQASTDPDNRWLDFKYINGRNGWGLNKPAVFTHGSLTSIMTKYRDRTGRDFTL